jgi:hypothetical protein
MAAVIVGAIDQEAANASGAHLFEGYLLAGLDVGHVSWKREQAAQTSPRACAPVNAYGTKLGNRYWETIDIAQNWLNSDFPMGRSYPVLGRWTRRESAAQSRPG